MATADGRNSGSLQTKKETAVFVRKRMVLPLLPAAGALARSAAIIIRSTLGRFIINTAVVGGLMMSARTATPPCCAQTAPARQASANNDAAKDAPAWIWTPDHTAGKVPQTSCHFRKTIHLAEPPEHGLLEIAADDIYELFVNGKKIGRGSTQKELNQHDISSALRKGKNVIAVKVTNRNGDHAGFAARISIDKGQPSARVYATNPTWRCSLKALPLWTSTTYPDDRWLAAKNLGLFGETAPWSEPTKKRGLLSVVQQETSTEDAPQKDSPDDEHPRFRLPAGFQVQHVVGHEKTGSLIAMAFNEFGQLLASQEGGPLLLIYDTNKNNTPDEVRVCCERVKNCQGIVAISGRVYVVADGPGGAALYRLTDENHDGDYETVDPLVRFEGSISEHGPHGIVLGPDAMIYMVVGNHTKLIGEYEPTSPHKNYYEGDLQTPRYEDPRGHAAGIKTPGGAILRTDLQGKRIELYAGGLRNAYDLAFNSAGDLFVHDSDMESDAGTPWHRPTRLLHAIPGAEFGWRSGWAKWPTYYVDSLPAILDTGRGSPTGCVVYDHTIYPERYQGALFSCDWAQGEIYAMRLQPEGSGYRARREVFLQGRPLNVTDIDVGPDGWVYFTTGGRGTRGNLYRVAYNGKPNSTPNWKGVAKALRQPQIQSAWGRQLISSARRDFEDTWDKQISNFVFSSQVAARYRAQALGLMHLVGPPPSDAQLVELAKNQSASIRVKAAYLLGMIANDNSTKKLMQLLGDTSPKVRRAACEGLARTQTQVPLSALTKMLLSNDRVESWSARRLLEINPDHRWQAEILQTDRISLFVQGSVAVLVSQPDAEIARQIAVRATQLCQGFVPAQDMLDLTRTIQLAFVRGELEVDSIPEVNAWIAKQFPNENQRVNRELIRLAVRNQQSDLIGKMLEYMSSDIPTEDKLHVATQLRFMNSGWTEAQQAQVLLAYQQAKAYEGGKNLARYIDRFARDFTKSLAVSAHEMVLARADEMPDMALMAMFQLPTEGDEQVIPRLIALDRRIAGQDDDRFKDLRVGIVAILARHGSEDSMGYLREIYDRDPPRRQVVAMGLAQKPGGRNWDYLVRSIPILDGEPLREVLIKLREVEFAPESNEHVRQVILSGLKLQENGGMLAAQLLQHWTGETPPGAGQSWDTAMTAWQRWFENQNPDRPTASLPVESGQNMWTYEDLLTFLESDEGKSGSVEAGAEIYVKAQCAACHVYGNQGRDFGPDLTTLANRFQKREILESIVYPSQVISDQYISTTVLTDDGGTVVGMVVPGGDKNVLVLQPDGSTQAVHKSKIEELVPNNISSMPEGLLNSLSLQEIADLMAYLMSTPEPEVARRGDETPRP